MPRKPVLDNFHTTGRIVRLLSAMRTFRHETSPLITLKMYFISGTNVRNIVYWDLGETLSGCWDQCADVKH